MKRSATLPLLVLVCAVAAPARAQQAQLEFDSKPKLVECENAPCFRMDVLALDTQRQGVELPPNGTWQVWLLEPKLPPVQLSHVFVQKLTRSPGGASASSAGVPSSTARAQVSKVTFVLFDTSGSMNEALQARESKFTVARRQFDKLFSTFRDGIDRVAIAPFDSRRVVQRIRAATFESTRAGIRRQVDALRVSPKGNTALYSAVQEGLQILKPYSSKGDQVSLIVFTDGKNEVSPSDDPGLLDGDQGLQTVVSAIKQTGLTVQTIGYGGPSAHSFNEAALRAMAYPQETNYYNAANEQALISAFTGITKLGETAVRLLAGPLTYRRDQLSGQSIVLRVKYGELTTDGPTWEGPPLISPPYEGILTTTERAAVLKWPIGKGPNEPPLPSVIMRMVVLASYGALLAVLWFGVPRLVWPERYIPKPAVHAAVGRPARPQPGRPAPPAPRAGAGGGQRPEVTIVSNRPPAAGRAVPARPGGGAEAPPPRPPQASRPAAPPRPREGMPPRDSADATVFIPPPKKPGRDS